MESFKCPRCLRVKTTLKSVKLRHLRNARTGRTFRHPPDCLDWIPFLEGTSDTTSRALKERNKGQHRNDTTPPSSSNNFTTPSSCYYFFSFRPTRYTVHEDKRRSPRGTSEKFRGYRAILRNILGRGFADHSEKPRALVLRPTPAMRSAAIIR